MATTPNYAIVYPVVGNAITPLATHFANLANSVDAAFVSYANGRERRIGTDAQRAALTAPNLKDGLQWYSTDTDRVWLYEGTTWNIQPIQKFGVVSGVATDGAGDITITHGLGGTPTAAYANMTSDGPVVANQLVAQINSGSFTSTTFKIRIQRADTNMTAFGSNPVSLYWQAVRL
jgi:hypothetical protein